MTGRKTTIRGHNVSGAKNLGRLWFLRASLTFWWFSGAQPAPLPAPEQRPGGHVDVRRAADQSDARGRRMRTQKCSAPAYWQLALSSEPCWNRTSDPLVKNELL